jgi:phosphoribosyl 1,2-cyclic phosphodiesterase
VSLAITFWGTRGSIPAPGPGTAHYGGNTPCLTISDEAGHRLVIDAGTGIRSLGRAIEAESPGPLDVSLVLSHTHWDHIQGIPFFRPLYRPASRVSIFGPPAVRPGPSLEEVLRSLLAPAVFPVPLSALAATLTVTEITDGSLEVSGFSLTSIALCHPGATAGFSVTSQTDTGRVTYMTDNELGTPAAITRRAEFVRFLRETDILIHDAMYFETQLADRRGWGHSSARQAVELALEAGVRRLVLFHHDPNHDDATLELLLAEAEASRVRHGGVLDVTLAAEGSTLRC